MPQIRPPHILFELIMTKRCNLRCDYCPLRFEERSMSKEVMDLTIRFIRENRSFFEKFSINFFGGEPLLEFENIKYFLSETRKLDLDYSLGTNGLLLDKKKLLFLNEHEVRTFLTLDHASGAKTGRLAEVLKGEDLSLLTVNLVIAPQYLDRYPAFIKEARDWGVRNFTLLPLCSISMGWDGPSLEKLRSLVGLMRKESRKEEYALHKCTFEMDYSGLNEYVIDWDGRVFADFRTISWLFKQSALVSPGLRKEVDRASYVGRIGSIGLDQLLEGHKPGLLEENSRILMRRLLKEGSVQELTDLLEPVAKFS